MLKPEQIEDLHKIAGEIKSIDHVYGSGLMIPFGNKVNSSRAAMTYQQIPQAMNLNKPQISRVSTGYEKVYGDRSTSYLKADKQYEVLNKIRKFKDNDMVYALVLKQVGANYYHIIFRNEVESFAESAGVKINNKVIDSKETGDMINKDELLYRSVSYDGDMNYRYGINAKTMYTIDPAIVEDAIRASDKVGERLSSTSVTTFTIPKNNNDVLLNIYGDTKNYKVFPDIGEEVKDKILCTRRRIDYNNAQYLLKSKNLRKEMFGDVTYYASGVITDIDIYSNTPLDELPDDGSHRQVNSYLRQIIDYHREIRDSLLEIIEDPLAKYSDDIGVAFARARDVLSIGKTVKWNNELSVFDNMIINITVSKVSPAIKGSKLVGHHGNKGVIASIVPEEEMPRNEDGEYAEVIYSALSVIGRLNPSQLYEQEMNWLVDNILKGSGSNKKKFNSLMDLLSIVNLDQYNIIKDFYSDLSDKEKKKFLDEITSEFVIFQPPSKSISFKNYSMLVEKFKPKKSKFTIKNKDGTISNIKRKMIMSDSYVLRLKHEPITKFSARSKGTINPRTFLPIKSHSYSRGTALFNNQAIKLGNMEMDVLRLCNDSAALNYMTRLYCTSVVGRRSFDKLLNTDVLTDETEINMENSRSRIVDMFGATLLTCGLKLKFKFGDITPIELEVKEDIKEMPKKAMRVVFKDSYMKGKNRSE